MIREARYAGSWYEGSESRLKETLKTFFETDIRGPKKKPQVNKNGSREIIAVVSPHAGYIYSGAIAAHAYAEVALDGKPDLFIIVGIDHRGVGTSPASIQGEGSWKTPLGSLNINSSIASNILSSSKKIADSPGAHRIEHSLELSHVILYFL